MIKVVFPHQNLYCDRGNQPTDPREVCTQSPEQAKHANALRRASQIPADYLSLLTAKMNLAHNLEVLRQWKKAETNLTMKSTNANDNQLYHVIGDIALRSNVSPVTKL